MPRQHSPNASIKHRVLLCVWLSMIVGLAGIVTSMSPALAQTAAPSLDVDGNGKADAFTDGMLIARFLMDFTGTNLTNGVTDPNGTRNTPETVTPYLESLRGVLLDVDCNGTEDALSDGMLILRFLFGFKGDALLGGVADPQGCRNTPELVSAFLTNFLPENVVPPHSTVKCTTCFAKDFVGCSIVQTLPWTIV